MLMLVIQFSFVVNILQPVLIYHSSPFDALNRKIIKVVVIVVPRVCACLNWVTKSSQQQTDCCHEVGYLWLVATLKCLLRLYPAQFCGSDNDSGNVSSCVQCSYCRDENKDAIQC